MGTLTKIKNAVLKELSGAPGKSLSVDLNTIGDSVDNAELYHVPGLYSKPVDETVGVSIDVNGFNIIVATHDYNYDKDIDKGESILYSIDSDGNILSSAYVNKDGEFIVNDGTRSAVAFDKLSEGFDQLKTDFDNLVTLYNNHIHITTATVGIGPVGVISPTTSTGSSTTADIADSEVEKVRFP